MQRDVILQVDLATRGPAGGIGPIGPQGPQGVKGDTGPQGPGAGLPVYMTRAQLSAVVGPTAGTTVFLAEGLRSGIFTFRDTNFTSHVIADPRQALYIPPAADLDGSSGVWVRQIDGTALHLNWFGPAADFVTDDLPVFDAAISLLQFYGLARKLIIPTARFYLSGAWNIHCAVEIQGAVSAQGSGAGPLLRFGNNSNGIVINYGTTHGDGLGNQGDATGTTVQGITLWGGNVNVDVAGVVTSYAAGDSITGSGIRIRAPFVRLLDVTCAFFGGAGFNINASNGGAAHETGNANDFYLEHCQSIYNRGQGYYIGGVDANAGTFNTCSAISNGGSGFQDYSFLGNTYIQCHTRDNGVDDPVNSGGPVGTCVHAGQYWYVVAGQEAAASLTVPGTNTAVWKSWGGHPSCPAWVSGMTWVVGGPYVTNPANVNARNVFLGCYAESAQAAIQATYPSLFVGGLLSEVAFVGSATMVSGSSVGLASSNGFSVFGTGNELRIGQIGAGGTNQADEFVYHALGADNYAIGKSGATIRRLENNVVISEQWGLSSLGSAGWGAFFHWIGRLFIGRADLNPGVGMLVQCLNDLADLNGKIVRKGDQFFTQQADLSLPQGWVCTVAGTGGADAVFAPMAPLGIAAASNAELWQGDIAYKFISPARLFAAAAPVAVADAAVITLDFDTGINFNIATLAGNRQLANPLNAKPGQSGRIRVKQDATGNRALTFGTAWLFPGGDPVLSTAANTTDIIAYFVNAADEIEATLIKAIS